MNQQSKKRLEHWKVQSPSEAGFHEVISPAKSDCSVIHVFRLNLDAGETHTVDAKELEMSGVVIKGTVCVKTDVLDETLQKLDSFYICAGTTITFHATEDLIMYIAGATGKETGLQSIRIYDSTLPLADIHQMHGTGVAKREVMFTCEPALEAERLICGLTWSQPGGWTSWPPHQHEDSLEEVYCYFDMDDPKMGIHLSYLTNEERLDTVAHMVVNGTMILAPRGYHPTVAMPGSVNAYFWALAAFEPALRSYEAAIVDPLLVNEI